MQAASADAVREPGSLTADHARRWIDDGYFVVRALVDAAWTEELNLASAISERLP